MDDETERKFEMINMFLDNVLAQMDGISMKNTKPEMVAYVDAWQNELETIKFIIQ